MMTDRRPLTNWKKEKKKNSTRDFATAADTFFNCKRADV